MTNEDREKDMASRLFEAIAARVDQFFKAKNIQGGVRCGDDLFSPMDKHELTKSLLAYADEIRRECEWSDIEIYELSAMMTGDIDKDYATLAMYIGK